MSIKLIIDSCCDTTPELLEKLGAEIAPLKINLGDKTYTDGGSIDVRTLLAEMKSVKQAAGSACPSPVTYMEMMREADECFVVTLSAKLSGSYNAARVARNMMLEGSPEKKIHVFDSKSASAGEVRLALFIRERIDAGDSFEEIVEKGEAFIARQRTLFVLEDLGNLIKNGRINKATGLVASILAMCPIMSDDGNGEIKLAQKVRGLKNALQKLADMVVEQTADRAAKTVTMVIAYCNCPERAGTLRLELLSKCAALRDIILVPTGGLSTIYANNGGIILAF